MASRITLIMPRRTRERLVDDTVQQVLDRPAEVADLLRTRSIRPAALQGVEGAAHTDQRIGLGRILFPEREATFDGG